MYIDDKDCKVVAKVSLQNGKLTCTIHTEMCEHVLFAGMCSDMNKLVSPLL